MTIPLILAIDQGTDLDADEVFAEACCNVAIAAIRDDHHDEATAVR